MEQLVAFIGARKNSKRIPNKNLQMLAGKPILGHTIETAKASNIFDTIVINSDSDEILDIARSYEVETYKRPEVLGSDTTFLIDVVKEMIQTLEFSENTNIAVLFPTVPLRTKEDIQGVHQLYAEYGGAHPVISACKFEYPIHLALAYDEERRTLSPRFPEYYSKSTRHNDQETYYRANYAIVLNSAKRLLSQSNLIGEEPLMYEMPLERSIDIDEPYQFTVAEKLLLDRG
jgi:CMP-N,N'-diacetyllegionaminic acid synthase